MLFDIMSQRDAVAFSQNQDILKTAIISICDPDDGAVKLSPNPNIFAVLHLNFYDSEEKIFGSMTRSDADKIVGFVKSLPADVEQLVVHCTEGISRSAAVCAALMRWLEGDDSEIWSDIRYRPNIRCYRLVIDAVNRINSLLDRPLIYGILYKGAFWFRSPLELVPSLIQCDSLGNPTDSRKLSSTDPKQAWLSLPHRITEGKEYSSYPYGRVEIRRGVATVYLDESLCDPDSKRIIADRFMLYPQCGIGRVEYVTER